MGSVPQAVHERTNRLALDDVKASNSREATDWAEAPDFLIMLIMADGMGLPIWMIGLLVLVIVVLLAIAVARMGTRINFGFFAQVAAAFALVGIAWLFLDRLGAQDRAEYRRSIEARMTALTTQSLLPNSNLACLDAAVGDAVEEACEKALYSSPEQVSAALTYVGARLDVLRDIAALPERDQAAYERLRDPLVRSAQADRYGLVAQVLQGRDQCAPDKCYAFDFLKNHYLIVVNMTERSYETRVTRYASAWGEKQSSPAVAAAAPPSLAPVKELSQLPVNFPSAASIPPVSIMANEPGMPGQNGMDAAPRSAPPRRPAEKKAPPPARQQARPQLQPQEPQPQSLPFPEPVAPPVQASGVPATIQPQ